MSRRGSQLQRYQDGDIQWKSLLKRKHYDHYSAMSIMKFIFLLKNRQSIEMKSVNTRPKLAPKPCRVRMQCNLWMERDEKCEQKETLFQEQLWMIQLEKEKKSNVQCLILDRSNDMNGMISLLLSVWVGCQGCYPVINSSLNHPKSSNAFFFSLLEKNYESFLFVLPGNCCIIWVFLSTPTCL